MISLLMLTLSVSSISSLPRIKTSPPNYHSSMGEGSAEKACSTVNIFGQSLKSALLDEDVPLCMDSKPKSRYLIILFQSCNVSIFFSVECTTASLELLKKCLDANKVDDKCLQKVYEKLSEDKDCFCGGLLKFSEMLSSVEALLCAGDQGRVARLIFPGGGIFPNLLATTLAPTTATTEAPTTGTTAAPTAAGSTTVAPKIAPNTATTAAISASPNPGGSAETRTLSITYTWAQETGGLARTAFVSIPATSAGQKVPVVFHLHGKIWKEILLVNSEVSRQRRSGEHTAICCLP